MRWIALLLVFATTTAHAEELRGMVVSITDGDTITVLDANKVQHKIRLLAIDAPERKQAFGTKSKEALSHKIGKKNVTVVWKKKDRYGRILDEVKFDRRNINLEMVR